MLPLLVLLSPMDAMFNYYTVEKRRRKQSHVKKQELSEEARGCPALREESGCPGDSSLASTVPPFPPEAAESIGVGAGRAGEEELPKYGTTASTEDRRKTFN